MDTKFSVGACAQRLFTIIILKNFEKLFRITNYLKLLAHEKWRDEEVVDFMMLYTLYIVDNTTTGSRKYDN